ncbi:MAG: hypothetical protein M1824_000810 [Vezdaea acicularis]|nr:MAG: hypothetical protein M1824_000810 [Vezdaea acicularis]
MPFSLRPIPIPTNDAMRLELIAMFERELARRPRQRTRTVRPPPPWEPNPPSPMDYPVGCHAWTPRDLRLLFRLWRQMQRDTHDVCRSVADMRELARQMNHAEFMELNPMYTWEACWYWVGRMAGTSFDCGRGARWTRSTRAFREVWEGVMAQMRVVAEMAAEAAVVNEGVRGGDGQDGGGGASTQQTGVREANQQETIGEGMDTQQAEVQETNMQGTERQGQEIEEEEEEL